MMEETCWPVVMTDALPVGMNAAALMLITGSELGWRFCPL